MMKHKIASLCLICLLAGLLVFAGVELLLAGSAPKVTGGVGFMMTNGQGEEVRAFAEFEAKAVFDSVNNIWGRGWIKYHDAGGMQFRVDVQCLRVFGDSMAFFSGPVVSASDTMLIGQYLLVGVWDGGTPGSKGDKIWGEFYHYDPGCSNFPSGEATPVESGNLVIH
jgi:hypothetical protein